MVTNVWVLVMDDDSFTRQALVDILGRAGYRVTSMAGVGAAGQAPHYPQRYQVAVVDYHLPHLDGLEVAKRLKELQPDCRIVLISSELPQFAAVAGQGTVVDYFLAKPFSKDTILEVIAQLCPTPAA
jgi:CheY-like chemotaxis protein